MSTAGSFEAIPVPPDGYMPGEFVAYRQPDAVRAAALANAVESFPYISWHEDQPKVDHILAIAKAYERYLTGEEAHDPT